MAAEGHSPWKLKFFSTICDARKEDIPSPSTASAVKLLENMFLRLP